MVQDIRRYFYYKSYQAVIFIPLLYFGLMLITILFNNQTVATVEMNIEGTIPSYFVIFIPFQLFIASLNIYEAFLTEQKAVMHKLYPLKSTRLSDNNMIIASIFIFFINFIAILLYEVSVMVVKGSFLPEILLSSFFTLLILFPITLIYIILFTSALTVLARSKVFIFILPIVLVLINMLGGALSPLTLIAFGKVSDLARTAPILFFVGQLVIILVLRILAKQKVTNFFN
ncbi:MAG: hypothetical protein ACRC6X_02935 [Culicoidibacterales bacterium]